ncbi:MAG: 50S ribosomal protein L29 [Candidatus Ryanbacteria bacterium RIFCSPHIGHO2_02_FULL_45_17b]|uniref:Large ribosomal subunit protein uL29 n=1 Tax=Candidatus Ryanbacteria bacterium RIFCSPHIGHO2_01_FULL_45_22 TaxID=1802114 RepID=A0A1G2G1E9_9BACT|nr:MAG: 50S ribosomal protein L29 [Candidatus Ryanbacteria bacterium RIFCSPHIGHO2_01_FULL_45_22]OGZ46452.1 MAG: 50S ribosomal protein L29 [Candidatus Ryanbacteria bacterium RIFCSPHIGHO2_02_FULL_45_17b]
MNIRDIKEKTIEELLQMLPTVERQLSDARFSLAAGRVKNVKEAGSLRRTIAQIKTVIHERKAR